MHCKNVFFILDMDNFIVHIEIYTVTKISKYSKNTSLFIWF